MDCVWNFRACFSCVFFILSSFSSIKHGHGTGKYFVATCHFQVDCTCAPTGYLYSHHPCGIRVSLETTKALWCRTVTLLMELQPLQIIVPVPFSIYVNRCNSQMTHKSKKTLFPFNSISIKMNISLQWLPWIIYIYGKTDVKLSPVKRICVFEHSFMTHFNCACPAIQRSQGSGFLTEGSSWFTACMSEQRRFWRDCADAQARLNLRCSHGR